jgi:predicted thioesterase
MTARNSILPHLEPGFDSVGTHVDLRHLAATPLGLQVTFKTRVTAVTGSRVTFRVEAHDEREMVAEGTHERAVVNIARFASRVQDKASSIPS